MTLEYLKQYFAEQIANERKRRDWSQKELADKADVGETVIGQIENARGNQTFKTIDKIAKALDMDILELCPQKKGIITIDLNALEALKNK